MAGAIEDYALIGDMHTAALVCRDGPVDWNTTPGTAQAGNTPQALSHVPLIQVALNLSQHPDHLSRRNAPPAG